MTAGMVVVEVLGSHARVQSRERILLTVERRSFTIGRSADCDVMLDDPYAAAMHARVEISLEGKVRVSDLLSVNGIVAGGKRHHGADNLELADGLFQVGRTQLRVRTASELLAPERPDHYGLHTPHLRSEYVAAFGALACAAYFFYAGWLGAPRDTATAIVTLLILGTLAAGIWITVWSLLSRVMQGEWRWIKHSATLLGVSSVLLAVDGLMDLGWFVFSLPQWDMRAILTSGVAIACILYLHLTHASNLSRRRAAVIACIVPLLSLGAGQWVYTRQKLRDVNHIGASQSIYPPEFRLRAAGSLNDYFSKAMRLKPDSDERRKAIRDDDADDQSDLDDS